MKHETIEKLMRLSMLDLRDEEKSDFPSQMKEILDYIDKLQKIDTSGVAPLDQPFMERMRLYPDKREDFKDVQKIARNAPCFEDGFFKVKKVMK